MTFVFPGDYLAIPTTYEGMTIVEIKNNDKKFADVAIVALSQDNSESLESMLASSYDDFYSKQIKKIYKNSSEGYQFTQVNQDESAIYTYIKNSDYIAMIKFYESYYKPNQPLIKISNQLLLKDFYALVNSFQIAPSTD
jgi:hypothetical protein